MKKTQVKIRLMIPPSDKMRYVYLWASNHMINIALVVVFIFFLTCQILPSIKEYSKLNHSIQHEKKFLKRSKEKLRQVKLGWPFTRKWNPNHYRHLNNLCTNDTLVHLRLNAITKKSQIKVYDVDVRPSQHVSSGYDFQLELIGEYSDLLQYLKNAEKAFSFIQINSMDISPEFAENKYKGLIHMSLKGWIW